METSDAKGKGPSKRHFDTIILERNNLRAALASTRELLEFSQLPVLHLMKNNDSLKRQSQTLINTVNTLTLKEHINWDSYKETEMRHRFEVEKSLKFSIKSASVIGKTPAARYKRSARKNHYMLSTVGT